jgi:CHAT domain-containing protein/predicted negative regulator of RcsB-dependent stress response
MRFITGSLAGVLITSLTLGGARGASAAVDSHADAPIASVSTSEVPQAGGASEEREQGRALLHRGRAAEALVHLERALKSFQQSSDRAGEASTQDLLGELYERQGRYDLALEHYRAAHELYAGSASSSTGGKLPTVSGGGKLSTVTSAASASATLTTEESGYNAQLMLAKMGQMLYRRGDLAGARATYARMQVSKPDTSAGGKVKRTKGLLGGLGVAIGSDNSSVRVGAPTAGGLLTVKDQLGHYRKAILYATHELGLGRADYQEQQLDSARKHFENVLEVTKGDLPLLGKLGQSRRYRAAARTNLGDVALKQGDFKGAAKLYEDAAKGARDDKRLDLMWPAQRGLGRSLWQQAASERDQKKAARMRDDALASYRQALDTIETIRQGSLRADESRTTFLATTGEVFDEASGALAEMALMGAQPVATQPVAKVISSSMPTAADAASANSPATSAPLEGQALTYASEALGVVERGRARSLLDMLNEAGAEITEGVPAELLQQRRANQARQEEIASLLTGVSLGATDKQKRSPEELEDELNKLQAEFDSIENRIRTASPRYAQLTASHPLALEEIRSQVLDNDTALLEYSLGESRSYLFAVTRAGFTVSRLPGREEVGRLVVAFRQQVIPATLRRSITDLVAATDPQRGLRVSAAATTVNPAAVASYAQAAQALYRAVVEPAAPLFKESRLLVVADGALNYVPFHALVTATPTAGADFSTLSYLLKTNDSLFAPSASVVAAIRQQRAASADSASGGMLVLADPVFDVSDARARGVNASAQQVSTDAGRAPGFESAVADVTGGENASGAQSASSERRGVLVRLEGTRTEAQQIAKLASGAGRKADVWLGLDANESELESRDLRQYRVLHFATHGLLNAERPQFTGVVLSLVGNREGTDGFLRTDEVFNLKLGSPLVMLSACETGLGREKRGEGVMGLSRAFMYAGSPTVGVSLWSVADKSTADLMTDFYKHLLGAQPTTPTAAMRAARLGLIGGKKFSAPFYWAPFVLVGDWK